MVRRETLRLKKRLSTETVDRSSFFFEGIDDAHCRYRIAFGVFGVCKCVSNGIFKKPLKTSTNVFVDQARNPFHPTTAGQTTDFWLRDAPDVVGKRSCMARRASLSESLHSHATSLTRSVVDVLSRNLGGFN